VHQTQTSTATALYTYRQADRETDEPLHGDPDGQLDKRDDCPHGRPDRRMDGALDRRTAAQRTKRAYRLF